MHRLVLLLLLLTPNTFAASFDCSKAATPVEKTICATPRLSALDDELAATYAAARKSGGAAVREAQKKWMGEDRDTCDGLDECIEAAYLKRIAELRLQHRALFARQKPPASIVGRYSFTHAGDCGESEEEDAGHECDEEVEDFIDIRRVRGNELVVNSELWFYMGHQCNVDDAPAEWVGNELRVALLDPLDRPECVLLLRFEGNQVSTFDPLGRCRGSFCGARGGFHDLTLPKKKK